LPRNEEINIEQDKEFINHLSTTNGFFAMAISARSKGSAQGLIPRPLSIERLYGMFLGLCDRGLYQR
jgi:hypothetical protein